MGLYRLMSLCITAHYNLYALLPFQLKVFSNGWNDNSLRGCDHRELAGYFLQKLIWLSEFEGADAKGCQRKNCLSSAFSFSKLWSWRVGKDTDASPWIQQIIQIFFFSTLESGHLANHAWLQLCLDPWRCNSLKLRSDQHQPCMKKTQSVDAERVPMQTKKCGVVRQNSWIWLNFCCYATWRLPGKALRWPAAYIQAQTPGVLLSNLNTEFGQFTSW